MKNESQEQLSEKAKAAQAARDRQYRRYRRIKQAELRELCREQPFGQHLAEFARQIRTFISIDQGAEYMDCIRQAAEEWICDAPERFRAEAEALAARQVLKIRLRAGLAPFDDPLPTSDDDIYQILKRVLEPH